MKSAADAEVRKAVDRAQSAYSACLAVLAQCDPHGLAAAMSGTYLDGAIADIEGYKAKGYAARDLDTVHLVVESVEVSGDSATSANAVVCFVDHTVLFRPGAGPGGADVIVDDSFLSARQRWTLDRGAGGWRLSDATPIGAQDRSRSLCGNS